MIIAESEGVGQKRLQFTIRIPMSLGFTKVLEKSSSIAPNMTSSASFLASCIEGLGGSLRTASGKYVLSPRPALSRIFRWNSRFSSVKKPLLLDWSMNIFFEHLRASSGL
ncbi:hypothetical protein V8G54_006862 [Vigna mungo]|uniref:Uncharacterized protein n=1 Tax=Vigna mungo TaxID=3915 RepID=A0AAQ3P286_VIGMU